MEEVKQMGQSAGHQREEEVEAGETMVETRVEALMALVVLVVLVVLMGGAP